jgi:cobalt-zinc-cadmium efflux system outer membrane protein
LTSVATGLVLFTGCAKVRPQEDFARVRQLITESTGVEAVYDPDQEIITQERIDEMLLDGLSLDEALQITLMNNRGLQADFMDIGIAKADWVQSGLMTNPSLGLSLRFPEAGGRSNLEVSLAQNIVDLWQIPIRKRAAQRALDASILQIARQAGQLAAETKAAYYRAVAADELFKLSQENLELVRKTHQAVQAQRQAGMASELDENLARGQLLSSELKLRNAKLAKSSTKRLLARRLALHRDLESTALTDPLPEAQPDLSAAAELIDLAREVRLDLRALSEQAVAAASNIRLEHLKVFPNVTIGPSAERSEGRASAGRNILADAARSSLAAGAPTAPDIQSRGQRDEDRRQEIEAIVGFALSITLPLWDQNQAQIAKAHYQWLQALRSYEALYLSVAQDIRLAADVAGTSSENLEYYRTELLPQARKNLEFAKASYTSGQAGLLLLLVAQRSWLEARGGYVDVWLDAATALTELEHAVGLPLEGIRDRLAETPSAEPTTTGVES